MNENVVKEQIKRQNLGQLNIPVPPAGPTERNKQDFLQNQGAQSQKSNVNSIFRGGGLMHPLSKLFGSNQQDSMNKLRPIRRTPMDIETVNSPSRRLEPFLSRLRVSGRVSAVDQMKLRFSMWTEQHTSVIPLIYEKLEQIEQRKERDETSKKEYQNTYYGRDEPKTLKRMEDSINSFLSKYEPLTQLSNFIFTGRTPKQVVQDIYKDREDPEKKKRIEKVSSDLGLPKNALRLVEADSGSITIGGGSYDQKMLMLSSSRHDLLRHILQEMITVRKHGFGIESTIFREPVGESSLSKIANRIKEVFTKPLEIPGVNALFNLLKFPSNVFESLSKAGGWLRDSILGKDFLRLQDTKEAEKAAGIHKSLDQKYKEFIVQGLPGLLEDIRITEVSQLEAQRNIYQVLKNQYELLTAVHTGKMESPVYQEIGQELKERRAYDPYEAAMLTAEALEKAEEKRTKQRRQAREGAFERGILGRILGWEKMGSVSRGMRGITRKTGGVVNLLGDSILTPDTEEQERSLERSRLHRTGRAEDVQDFSESRERKRREFQQQGGPRQGIAPFLGTAGGLAAGAMTGGLALPLLMRLGGIGLGASKYGREKAMQRRDFIEYSNADIGFEETFGRQALSHKEELGKSSPGEFYASTSASALQALSEKSEKFEFIERIFKVLGLSEKDTLREVLSNKFDKLIEIMKGNNNTLESIESNKGLIITLNKVKEREGYVEYASAGGTFNPGNIIITGEPGEDEGPGAKLTGREEIIKISKDGKVHVTGQRRTSSIFERRGIETRSDLSRFKNVQLMASGSDDELGMRSQLEDLKKKRLKDRISDRWDRMLNYLAEITGTTEDLYARQVDRDKENKGIFGKIISKIGDLFSMFGPLVAMALPVIGMGTGAFALGSLTDWKIGGKATASLLDLAARNVVKLLSKGIDKIGTKVIADFSLSGYISKIASKTLSTITTGIKSVGESIFTKLAKSFPKAAKLTSKLPYEKIFGNLGKWTSKYIAPNLLKKVPGLGAIIGFGFGIQRMRKSQYFTGLLEMASGLASTFPVVGTGISIGLDTVIALSDLIGGEKEQVQEPGVTFGSLMARLTKHLKGVLNIAGKGAGILKRVPGLGVMIGLGLGAQRIDKGQYFRGALEMISGLSTIVPGVGTAASIGLDAVIMLTDYLKKEPEKEEKDKPKEGWLIRFGGWMKDKITNFSKSVIGSVPFIGDKLVDFLFKDEKKSSDITPMAKQFDPPKEKFKPWLNRFGGWLKDNISDFVKLTIRTLPLVGGPLSNFLFGDGELKHKALEREIKKAKEEAKETSDEGWLSKFVKWFKKQLSELARHTIESIPFFGSSLAGYIFDDKSMGFDKSIRNAPWDRRDLSGIEKERKKREKREKNDEGPSKFSIPKRTRDLGIEEQSSNIELERKLQEEIQNAKYIKSSLINKDKTSRGIMGNQRQTLSMKSSDIDVPEILKNELGPENAKLLRHQLIVHEGVSLRKYKDSLGYPTIGVGHKIEKGENIPNKITYEQAISLFNEDLKEHYKKAKRLSFFDALSGVRKSAIIDMVYNMGLGGVRKFRETISNIKDKNFREAAEQLLQSKYARQVGDRAKTISNLIRTSDPSYFKTGKPQIIAASRGLITSKPTPVIAGEDYKPEAIVPLTRERFRNFTKNIDVDRLKEEKEEIDRARIAESYYAQPQQRSNVDEEREERSGNNKPIMIQSPSTNIGKKGDDEPKKTKIDGEIDFLVDRLFNNSGATFAESVKEFSFGNTATYKFH